MKNNKFSYLFLLQYFFHPVAIVLSLHPIVQRHRTATDNEAAIQRTVRRRCVDGFGKASTGLPSSFRAAFPTPVRETVAQRLTPKSSRSLTCACLARISVYRFGRGIYAALTFGHEERVFNAYCVTRPCPVRCAPAQTESGWMETSDRNSVSERKRARDMAYSCGANSG